VRVLPDHNVVKKCQELGLRPKDIIAMQGPFSKEMNRLMFKTFNASVVVIKESGRAGGTETKMSAALSLKIPVVVIKRPALSWGNEVQNYEALLAAVAQFKKMR
jgi:precorrin-6A/cobalt-precorrin-6A reductase